MSGSFGRRVKRVQAHLLQVDVAGFGYPGGRLIQLELAQIELHCVVFFSGLRSRGCRGLRRQQIVQFEIQNLSRCFWRLCCRHGRCSRSFIERQIHIRGDGGATGVLEHCTSGHNCCP